MYDSTTLHRLMRQRVMAREMVELDAIVLANWVREGRDEAFIQQAVDELVASVQTFEERTRALDQALAKKKPLPHDEGGDAGAGAASVASVRH